MMPATIHIGHSKSTTCAASPSGPIIHNTNMWPMSVDARPTTTINGQTIGSMYGFFLWMLSNHD
jgi:hypothetical protein